MDILKLTHQSKDIASIIYNIFQRSYRIEADLIGVTSFYPLEREVNHIITSKTTFYGIKNGNQIAGLIEIEFQDNELYICSLVVEPSFFKQGQASKLLRFTLSKFQWKKVKVETAALNIPAVKLYQKHGFKLSHKYLTSEGIEKVVFALIPKNS